MVSANNNWTGDVKNEVLCHQIKNLTLTTIQNFYFKKYHKTRKTVPCKRFSLITFWRHSFHPDKNAWGGM